MQRKRFVIQEHTTATGTHWDLMLEQGDVLTTFRLAEMPTASPTHAIRAEKIFDHPLRFLTYEGSVQQGTGHVRIVDRGRYRLLASTDLTIAMALEGHVLQSDFTLTRTRETLWFLTSKAASA